MAADPTNLAACGGGDQCLWHHRAGAGRVRPHSKMGPAARDVRVPPLRTRSARAVDGDDNRNTVIRRAGDELPCDDERLSHTITITTVQTARTSAAFTAEGFYIPPVTCSVVTRTLHYFVGRTDYICPFGR